ncbi:MAG TPA: phage integrase N-terminal SAM-like domain-containing protein [Pyrinomonadaceae bacterium]
METLKPKLLDQVRREARLRHLSLKTERAYIYYIRRFILFHNKGHPSEMGADEIPRLFNTSGCLGKGRSFGAKRSFQRIIVFVSRSFAPRVATKGRF